MNRNAGMNVGQIIGTMNGQQVIGLDIAKHVFQMHTVDMGTGEVINVQIKRAKVLEHFANKSSSLIAMEACGGAHHWARALVVLGHTVRLLHAKAVRPFVAGNKTDATDARAIWLAVQQPGVKFVGIKTTAQQATLTLHRQRELLMKMRTMQTNALRGLLYEFGATFAQGRKALFKDMEQTLEELSAQLPQMVADSLREQLERVKALSQDIQLIEKAPGLAAQGRHADAAHCPDTWRGVADGHGGHCHHGTGRRLQVRAGVLRLAGSGAQTNRQRGQSPPGRHLPAWRHVPENPADSRSPKCAQSRQGTRPVAGADQGA
jgi:transposase